MDSERLAGTQRGMLDAPGLPLARRDSRCGEGWVSKSPQLEEARNLLSNLRGEAQKDGPRRSACEAPKRVQFGAKADPPNFRELPAVKVDAELAADEVDPSSSCSTAPSLTVQEDGSSPAKNGFPFAAACEAKEEASESGSTGSASGYVFLESGVFIDRSSPDSGESSESGESEHSKGEPPAKAQRKLSKLRRGSNRSATATPRTMSSSRDLIRDYKAFSQTVSLVPDWPQRGKKKARARAAGGARTASAGIAAWPRPHLDGVSAAGVLQVSRGSRRCFRHSEPLLAPAAHAAAEAETLLAPDHLYPGG
ncbi:unnamed protein product [Effrenium voratum]|nr:unnamed protein product [Effrenium voratum]